LQRRIARIADQLDSTDIDCARCSSDDPTLAVTELPSEPTTVQQTAPPQLETSIPELFPNQRMSPMVKRGPWAGNAIGSMMPRPLAGGRSLMSFQFEKEGIAMSVTLAKGGNVSLSKQAPNLTAVAVGLGWDVRATTGADFDLDASALATGPTQKVLSDRHFVFYNNLESPEGTIEHTGDNLTGEGEGEGEGEGDDEVINVDLAATPPTITNIFFPVSIHDADARQQSFGQVRNAYIRVIDRSSGAELARYDLTEDASTETAMVFGELYRHGTEWKFRAIGQGYASGLGGIARDYGVNV